MITTPLEYYSKLNLILNENPPLHALLPKAENIYNIDLNTRTIDAPKFLGVNRDHKSETIYFIVDRYADYMDLSQTCCMITYINAASPQREARHYCVPFYDIYTYAREDKMLIPWNLDATVLAFAGTVEFSISFYKISEVDNQDTGISEKILSYNLNTLPAKSVVREGINIKKFDIDTQYLLTADEFQVLQSQIDNISRDQILYWTILD